jgi:electron transfer flavoprotein alpha subunit
VIWIFAEVNKGSLAKVTQELLGKANSLRQESGMGIASVLIGSKVEPFARELAAIGSDQVYIIDDPQLEYYQSEPYTIALAGLLKEHSPEIFLLGATDIGLDLAPRVAAKLATGLTAHCVDLKLEKHDDTSCLHQVVPVWGSGIMAEMICPQKRPQMATIKPGTFDLPLAKVAGKGSIINVAVRFDDKHFRARTLEVTASESSGIPIEEADILIAVGWGVHVAGVYAMAQKLADSLHAEIAATRPMVDQGYVPADRMIGQSGKIVNPRLFISLGASGAMHFTTGFIKSRYILAIDQNPEAPIFKVADLGIVGDLARILPPLIEKTGEIGSKIL